ncbi:MAG: AAA family ATPase [Clostridia bacterium]|nr:AAA family ATPase [Clostridia bacterium]
MKNHVLVCGLNGSGKSTFAKALAESLGAAFKDMED